MSLMFPRDQFGDIDVDGIVAAHESQLPDRPACYPVTWRKHDGELVSCRNAEHLDRVRRADVADLREDLTYRLSLERMGIDL